MGSSLSIKKKQSEGYSVNVKVVGELNANITEIVYCKEGLEASSSFPPAKDNPKPGIIRNHAFILAVMQTGTEVSIDYRSNGVTFDRSSNVERSNMVEVLRVKPPFINTAASGLLRLTFAYNLADKWINEGDYNPLTRNCQHFAVYLFRMCVEEWAAEPARSIERLQQEMNNAQNYEDAAKLAEMLDSIGNFLAASIALERLVGQELDGGLAGGKWG